MPLTLLKVVKLQKSIFFRFLTQKSQETLFVGNLRQKPLVSSGGMREQKRGMGNGNF